MIKTIFRTPIVWLPLIFVSQLPVSLSADTVTLIPIKDVVIFGDPLFESKANGKSYLNTGQTQIKGLRRAMLEFDIATAVPAGATIESVSLLIPVLKNGLESDNETTGTLHRVLTEWSEGDAGFPIKANRAESSGEGYDAGPGDSTWVYSEVQTIDPTTKMITSGMLWNTPGGDFEETASASTTIGYGFFTPFDPDSGKAVWQGTDNDALVADVQLWLDDPDSNHGWMFLGDEDPIRGLGNARTYGSREAVDPDPPEEFTRKPNLTISYTVGVATDNDILNDNWEQAIVDADPDDAIRTVDDVLDSDDFNGDGTLNVMAYALGYSATEWVAPVAGSPFPEAHVMNRKGHIRLKLPEPRPAGITYVIEISETLDKAEDWMELARLNDGSTDWTVQENTTVFAVGNSPRYNNYRVESGTELSQREFYRLRLIY